MGNWNNFFMQKMPSSGSLTTPPVYESVDDFGIWCKGIPFKLYGKVKETYSNTWLDEQGDDEYLPDELMMEAYQMEVEFGCKLTTSVSDVREKVSLFLDYLRGADLGATGTRLKIYSTYTRIGRQDVRLLEVSDDAEWYSEGGEEFLVFKVVFKVNDPVTDITLTKVVSNGG